MGLRTLPGTQPRGLARVIYWYQAKSQEKGDMRNPLCHSDFSAVVSASASVYEKPMATRNVYSLLDIYEYMSRIKKSTGIPINDIAMKITTWKRESGFRDYLYLLRC